MPVECFVPTQNEREVGGTPSSQFRVSETLGYVRELMSPLLRQTTTNVGLNYPEHGYV
jgi:hypothetical protein